MGADWEPGVALPAVSFLRDPMRGEGEGKEGGA